MYVVANNQFQLIPIFVCANKKTAYGIARAISGCGEDEDPNTVFEVPYITASRDVMCGAEDERQ